MSKYVNRMRDVLLSFNRKALQIGADIADSQDRYSEVYAAEEIAKHRFMLNQAAADAKDQMDEIHKEAQAAAQKWAALDGQEVDASDLSLLRGDFVLSAQDIGALVAKNWDNGTMINAIDKYVKQHHIACYVPNLDDKLQAYKILAQSAHNLIGSIAESAGVPDNQIADWGKSGNVSDRLERALYGI